jgi:hypothetical protein
MAGPERTRRKARFGRYMEDLCGRTDPKQTPKTISATLGCAGTTITRMFGGYTVPSRMLVNSVLGLCAATDDERAEALRLWEDAKQPSATLEFQPDGRPQSIRAFYQAEWEAVKVVNMATRTIPGLLQTSDYVRAIELASPPLADVPVHVESRVRARQGRQRRLSEPNPITLEAYIDEGIFRRMVGGPVVMHAQLNHLLAQMDKPNITVCAIPDSAGAYGPMSGPVTVLHFPDPDDPAAVYLEYPGSGAWVEDKATVEVFNRMLANVATVSLSTSQTAELIRERMRKLAAE